MFCSITLLTTSTIIFVINILTKLAAFFYTCLILLLCGCAEYIDDHIAIEETTRADSRDIKDALYHEGTESWIMPQKDPYSLENFQTAYDNLSSGKSIQTIPKSFAKDFSGSERFKATHYSLKIYPKDEKQQQKIESIEDIKIAYIPFNYIYLTEEEAKNAEISKLSKAAVYPETRRYTVTYDDLRTVEGFIESETYIMPVLYAVWPCGKPFPEGIDYEIDYEIFIPDQSRSQNTGEYTRNPTSLSENAIQILENEAIILALGSYITIPDPIPEEFYIYKSVKGRLCNRDTFLNSDVPFANLKVRFQLGSNIWDYYTDANGYFVTERIPVDAAFSFIFQHTSLWKITKENSTSPVSNNYGNISSIWGSRPEISWTFWDASCHRYTIHRAISYYYFGGSGGVPMLYSGGVWIKEMSGENQPSYMGYTMYDAYLAIFGSPLDAVLVGTVLHELGHYIEFRMKGILNFSKTHRLFQESWAGYVGWYLGEAYYKSLGWVKPIGANDITGNARQLWDGTHTEVRYTPLFVDLVDNHNQYRPSFFQPFDEIKDVPTSVICSIAMSSYRWETSVDEQTGRVVTGCKDLLQQYVGRYYTQAQLNNCIEPYDYWFAAQ